MTNQQKFIDTFGQETFDTLMSNCDNIDILKWFMKEYKEPSHVVFTAPLNIPVTVSENDVPATEQPKKRGGKPGRKTYNPVWYEETVEDFYLGSARTKDISLNDDPTVKKTKSLDGLKYRFEEAIKKVGVEDCVTVHKYYAGTVNECLVLENIRNPKTFIGSYKLS
jgi:hypothetical protein